MNFHQKKLKRISQDIFELISHISVDKYKTEEEKTLTRKISKLNMHSIGKKSTRIGQRFLSSIGIESTVKFSIFLCLYIATVGRKKF